MPRRLLLINFLNQLKSERTTHGYHPLKSSQDENSLCKLSSCETVSYVDQKSEDIKKFNDLFEHPKQIYHCPVQRILSRNAKQNFEIVYEIHNGFTSEQLSLIKNALQIVVDRLFKPEILKNMYQICSACDCFLSNGVWSHSNLRTDPAYNDQYLLLQYQLMCLKTASENVEFPTINIYPSDQNKNKENSDSLANVFCICHGSTFLIDGEFEIRLNQCELNQSGKNGSNTLFWAGKIIYELLRNLGHRCDDSCNAHQSQIHVFTNCFLHDGNNFPNKTE